MVTEKCLLTKKYFNCFSESYTEICRVSFIVKFSSQTIGTFYLYHITYFEIGDEVFMVGDIMKIIGRCELMSKVVER